jgi:hypothetical protein
MPIATVEARRIKVLNILVIREVIYVKKSLQQALVREGFPERSCA